MTEYAARPMECPACGANRPEMSGARFCPACGGELPDEGPDPMIGATVGGRFRVVNLIAEGGMGRVYTAEQRMGTTLRKVAIKTLLSEFMKSEAQVQRFLLECSMVSELEHPNTIKFYDWGQTDAGGLFIAMEFLSGESLAHVVHREGRLAAERVDLIVGQICGSLQEAHDKGIVHRDVKPENILLTNPAGEADFVKVLDFGIAKRLESDAPKLTPLGLVLGSPAYMSPEQFTHGDLDHRSDIYSLGVVSFEALTLHLPFVARELAEWPILHRHAEPLSFEAAGVHVPEGMRNAVMRALSKNPEDRQPSMREFYREFTMGTPRRSSLTAGHVAPDEAVTLLKKSSAPSAGSGPPPTRSAPPTDEAGSGGALRSSGREGGPISWVREGSGPPPPLMVPPPPRLPASMVPVSGGAASVMPATAPEPSAQPIAPSPLSRIPATEREPVPPTLREPPRRRWPFLLAGIALAIAVGGGIAALVLPRGRLLEDPPQPSGVLPRPKPSATIAPEHAPERPVERPR
jgi:eukaryotic-like serine/threonine-protein kinase